MSVPTMKAIVFKGPHEIALEDRPVPKIQDGGDVLVKVSYSALCGR
jgi:threonine dehydrogenase-like Zn-dependent dehydrogenase